MTDMRPGEELLSDLADKITERLILLGVPDDDAALTAEEIVMDQADDWGGQLIYFPKGKFIILSKRDRLIYSEFTGNNHNELSRRHKVCVQRIYTIIKTMTRRDLDDRHGDLFPDPDKPKA